MRRLDWMLHASAGFWVGFWGGLVALAIWLAWMASKDDDDATYEGWRPRYGSD